MEICFVGDLSSTFVERDYKILQEHFDVTVIEPPSTKAGWIKYPFNVRKKVKESDVVFGWFAGWHTAPAIHYAKHYGKRSILVAGGYDVVYLPEIDYGAFNSLRDMIPAKYTLKNADLIISVSKSNQMELLKRINPKKNVLVYNGVPVEDFYPGKKDKKDIAITVGGIKHSNLKRKGLEIFVKTARHLTDIPFIVIGEFIDNSIDYLKSIASNNVEFTGRISNEELLEWYQQAKIYVQPSAHEGFGISVAEAMLCECIPVVSDRFALPELVGDVGFVVPFGNIKATAHSIKNALQLSANSRKKSRERIIKKFSLEYRKKKLIDLLNEK